MTTNWNRKLAAWLHDPAEKALILLRDREGHERGTVRRLREKLEIEARAFNPLADWIASAADRPQWPELIGGRQTAVDFQRHPELIHPLSGKRIQLAPLDTETATAKGESLAHFERLIEEGDARATFLTFWRFGPELGSSESGLGELWRLLPADTRVPDHSIWNHVDLVSAIDTALAGDGKDPDEPALLTVSIGPVQGFIAQARKTSDLWAGSHLLSSLAWETMLPIVEALGPDAVLFPTLRGVPAVDLWLYRQSESFKRLYAEFSADFADVRTSEHPLFAASLPNKFLAVVPARQAAALGESCARAAQDAALRLGLEAAKRVFSEAEIDWSDVPESQVRAQFAGFPEVHWAAAPWPAARGLQSPSVANGDATAARSLQDALAAIAPSLAEQGVFTPRIRDVLFREVALEQHRFYEPNSGVLYPAVHELAERHLAAAKATREFLPLKQEGFRCTLTGDAEWLTHDRALLGHSRESRRESSVWGALAKRRPALAKAGEHLGALATLKRLWPTLFVEYVAGALALKEGEKPARFEISTHALAVSTTLERLSEPESLEAQQCAALESLADEGGEQVALPRRVHRAVRASRLSPSQQLGLRRLPSLVEQISEGTDSSGRIRDAVKCLLGEDRTEAYYAVIQMDGDRLGAWLSGHSGSQEGLPALRLAVREALHSNLAPLLRQASDANAALRGYLDAERPGSPGRHAAISSALSDFSLHVARHVVEDCCAGKLIYSGGDDILALVCIHDLIDCMQLLRLAYSGVAPIPSDGLEDRLDAHPLSEPHSRRHKRLRLDSGFALLNGRLMRMMGGRATASMGVVVAHHSTPLGLVLRQVRDAEKSAKDAGRNAFCIRVMKRSGGEESLTSQWWAGAADARQPGDSAAGLLRALRDALAATGFSRGVVYKAQQLFAGLTKKPPEDAEGARRWQSQLAGSLERQFRRQTQGHTPGMDTAALASWLAEFACGRAGKAASALQAVNGFLTVAEFLAREGRVAGSRSASAAMEESA